ncbi:tryptophan halogenase family protein [Sulfitobacter delicatus]|uniref:Tryptophan halogenase n=1 Tax=Sulfitobacter delicatus TaxID=218672 RepID=A0A1G7M368_9RHOB|nr:tryptophan halogenase family protein [Sulfitobacter delicatus]SDF56268.1 Tryptophan halogenase [Sulfitobacter delicatus]
MREVLIVGGGTAGWITALTLQKFVPEARTGPIKYTVVEPSDIGRIGVGEATIPSLKQTLARLGLSERKLLRRTGATFKHGIRFTDWRKGPDGGGDVYFHPFERNVSGKFERFSPYHPAKSTQAVFDVAVSEIATLVGSQQLPDIFSRFQGVQTDLCDRMLPPKTADMPEYDGVVQYAYHLDAEALGDWLKEEGIARGISVIDAAVVDVERTENGNIAQVLTRDKTWIKADFFVDCTGFRSVLMRGALEAEFKDYGRHLLCDRAVAARLPSRNQEPRPFTTASARRHGWTWDLDLSHRRGMGYVYSSGHISDDEAEAFLRAASGQGDAPLEVRQLKMETGRLQQFWIGNCAAVGLASGFLEPLESTGIGLIEIGAYQLASTLIFGDNGAAAREYSRRMRNVFDDAADFVVLHYILSERRDTDFWVEATADARLTDGLRDKLEQWQFREPNAEDDGSLPRIFGFESVRSVLYGMGRRPNLPRAQSIEAAQALKRLVRQGVGRAVSQLPRHSEVLADLVQEIAAPEHSSMVPSSEEVVAAGPGDGKTPIKFRPNDIERVSISKGSMSPSKEKREDYQAEALVPAGPWRELTSAEKDALAAPKDAPMGQLIDVLRFPAKSIVEEMRNLFSRPGANAIDLPSTAEYRTLLERLTAELAPYCTGEMRCLGVITHPPNMETVTRQGPAEPLIGLHVDSWSRTMLGERQSVPNRLCINIGSKPRYLLLAPITIDEMALETGLAEKELQRMNPTDVGRLYLRQRPQAPILRIRIEPGEAYIAPTENVVHDGASTGATDVSLTFLGRFRSIPTPQPA